MIFGLFAVGQDGSFGTFEGKLPWGSFPEELEQFYAVLISNKNDTIVIGKTTYETAPPRLREALAGRLVFIMGRNSPNKLLDSKHFWMPLVGGSFGKLAKRTPKTDILVLGGKATLEEFSRLGLLDGYIRSRIYGQFPQGDITLSNELVETPLDSTIVVLASGGNDNLSYTQEMVYL